MIFVEYVLFVYYFGEMLNFEFEQKIGKYLCCIQQVDGGWLLFIDGVLNISVSVKVYFVLKVIGDDENVEYMQCVCCVIYVMGGVEMLNVFMCIQFVLYGVILWCVVLMMLVEIMLLLQWFLFYLLKVLYWVCIVIVLLFVLNVK